MIKKKLLITGALGFIGRSLIDVLIHQQEQYEIYGIDIKELSDNCDFIKNQINYERIDIRNEFEIKNYLKINNFDGIIHLAAISRVKDAEEDKFNSIETNYFGTKYIMEIASENKNTWVIFSSSREVYGEQNHLPVLESAEKIPLNIYGFYKLEGERLVQKYIDRHFILRFSNVYGNMYDIPDRVIPKFVFNAFKNQELYLEGGEQVIDFTHISDTVSSVIMCIRLLESDTVYQEELHISPGEYNKITDLIDIIREEMNVNVKVRKNSKRDYDVERFVGDNSKRERLLGISKFLTLREGISQFYKLIKLSDNSKD